MTPYIVGAVVGIFGLILLFVLIGALSSTPAQKYCGNLTAHKQTLQCGENYIVLDFFKNVQIIGYSEHVFDIPSVCYAEGITMIVTYEDDGLRHKILSIVKADPKVAAKTDENGIHVFI